MHNNDWPFHSNTVLKAKDLVIKDTSGKLNISFSNYYSADCILYFTLYSLLYSLHNDLYIYIGSELYCQLGILNEHHLEKDMTKQKKNVKEWQKEKQIESAGMTSVTPRTLEPEWNEVVEL